MLFFSSWIFFWRVFAHLWMEMPLDPPVVRQSNLSDLLFSSHNDVFHMKFIYACGVPKVSLEDEKQESSSFTLSLFDHVLLHVLSLTVFVLFFFPNLSGHFLLYCIFFSPVLSHCMFFLTCSPSHIFSDHILLHWIPSYHIPSRCVISHLHFPLLCSVLQFSPSHLFSLYYSSLDSLTMASTIVFYLICSLTVFSFTIFSPSIFSLSGFCLRYPLSSCSPLQHLFRSKM